MTTPVSGVAPTAATAGTQQAAATQSSKNLLDPQAFLQLLVAQLRYQDPSNPVDTSAFLNQTATLSQVQTMNTMSSTLVALVSAQQAQAATSLIGKSVVYSDGKGGTATGVVTGATLGPNGPSVRVGDAVVALTEITEVNAPPSTTG